MEGHKQREKPGFYEAWGRQRRGGMAYTVLTIGSCVFILLLFAQLFYQTAKQDFSSFPFHPVFLLIAAGVGAAYWLVNERRYKRLKEKNSIEPGRRDRPKGPQA